MSDINFVFNNYAAVLVKGSEILEVKSEEKPDLFQQVVTLCMKGDKDEAFDLIIDSSNVRFITNRLATITDGMLSVDTLTDEVVFTTVDGRRLPIVQTFAQKIKSAWQAQDKGAIEVYKKFMIKASNNPNDVSASDLFEFITVNKLPLSTEGDVLAYKIVKSNFLDIHSGTKDHTPGNEVTEEVVDYNRDVTCSSGLHFCSKDYLPQYGGFFGGGNSTNKLILVKIDPSDVAAFPRDYNNAKGRCRKYTVVSELPAMLFTAIVDLMESVPYVDLNKLGATDEVRSRLGDQVKAHADTIIAATQTTVGTTALDSVVLSSDYRWYVALEGDNVPRKFVKRFTSRAAARDEITSLRNKLHATTYKGIVNPKVSLYDANA